MAWNDENITPSVTQETDAALVALGQRGCVYALPGVDIIGNFAAIQIVTDAVFTVITTTFSGENADPDLGEMMDCCTNSTAPTLPAGFIIYGPFTKFNLLSGTAIAYKA